MGLLRESSSRDRQTFLWYGALAVLFVFLYLVFAPRPLPAEFTLVPRQATVLADTPAGRLSPGGTYFLLGDREGYLSAAGTLEQARALRPQATVWGDKLAWYDAPRSQVVVESPSGPLFSLAGEQFPLWISGRLFTLDENRLGLTSFGPRGQLLWKKQFSSLITCLDASERLVVVGTLDGRVQVFGPDGSSVGGFQPGGSRLPVIYNVSLAPSEQTILVLAGVDPKRFLILERGGADFRPVFHKPLKESSPWPTPLGFLNKGSGAYYETDQGLGVLDPKDPSHELVISTEGEPQWVETLPGGQLLVFAQKGVGRSALRVASTTGSSVLTLPFAAQNFLLKLQGSSIFLGIDRTLLRLEVSFQ